MQDLTQEILEFIRRTSTDLPADVEAKLRASYADEEPGSAAQGALDTILQNVELARKNSTPICQDTGTPLFYVHYPEGMSTRKLKTMIQAAVVEATKLNYLRPNSVNAITGKNTGDNTGDDYYPTIHFEEVDEDQPLTIELMLKGGGCENVGIQYKLPDTKMGAGRDLAGVRKVVLDAVHQAQGRGALRAFSGSPSVATAGHPIWHPKRRSCVRSLTRTPIPNWMLWKNRSPTKPTGWGLVRWVLAEKPPCWIPKSQGCIACPPATLYQFRICAGHIAAAR